MYRVTSAAADVVAVAVTVIVIVFVIAIGEGVGREHKMTASLEYPSVSSRSKLNFCCLYTIVVSNRFIFPWKNFSSLMIPAPARSLRLSDVISSVPSMANEGPAISFTSKHNRLHDSEAALPASAAESVAVVDATASLSSYYHPNVISNQHTRMIGDGVRWKWDAMIQRNVDKDNDDENT